MSVNVRPCQTDNVCPTAEEWRYALRGKVNGQRWSEIKGHLLACSRCEVTVDALTEQSDTFVRELCQRPSTPDDEPAFRALYARLVADAAWGAAADDAGDDGASVELPFRLGNYELQAPLGHGASGSVFRALHVPLDRTVAIKLLRPDHDFDPACVDRFLQEVRAVGRLNHPHLVRATDAGQTDGRHFLAMEYVPGIDVSTIVASCPPLRPSDACEIVRQAALGLAYLHAHGFVHRDVKPSNLLLTADGQIKLLDLGLVQYVGKDRSPHTGQMSWPTGTPDYMAPEQWQAFDHFDSRSDMYSLGCTLFKLLTGCPPYRPLPRGFADRCDAHCRAPIPSLLATRPETPAAIQGIFERLVAKRPENRFATATDLLQALQPFVRGADLGALASEAGLEPVAKITHEWAPIRSQHMITRRRALLATASVLGGVAAGMMWLRRGVEHGTAGPQIQTDTWRDLSPKSPAVLLTRPEEASGCWDRDGDKLYIIRSPQPLLLNLGQPLLGNFRLTVDMQQPTWRGNAGLFFRFQHHLENDVSTHAFQSVELIRGTEDDPTAYRLLWSGYRVTENDDGRELRRALWADVPVATPEIGDTCSLELWLGFLGFPQVYWCGQHLPAEQWTISFEGRNQAAVADIQLPSQFLGIVGLVAAGEDTTFRQPRLAYVQSQDQGRANRG